MNKKGLELSIQFMFLIFIGTIAVVVIVGLMTGWAFDVRRYMQGWLDEDDKPILDIQRLNYTSCGSPRPDFMNNEVIKHAKLCYEKGRKGLVEGELCYGLIMPGTCQVNQYAVRNALTSDGINHSISSLGWVRKVLISYDYVNYQVKID